MNDFIQVLDEAIDDELGQISDDARARLADHLFNWLSFTAAKKPVADMPQRLTEMRKRIDALAAAINLSWKNGDFVVMASGESEFTLLALERGTDWFEPYQDLRDGVVAVLLTEPGI